MKKEMLKYQFYIHSEKRMIDAIGFCFEGTSHIRIWYMGKRKRKEDDDPILNESFNLSDVSKRSFTGLMRDDKPVYEGDIVQMRNWGVNDDRPLGVAVIVWDLDELALRTKPYIGIDDFYDERRAISEVLGNIFQNPELIPHDVNLDMYK